MEMTTGAFLILLAVIAAGAKDNGTTPVPVQPVVPALTNATTEIPTDGTTANTENPTSLGGATSLSGATSPGGTTSPDKPTTLPATKQPTEPSSKGDVTPQPIKPSPAPSTSSFNAPSFIGGIVLGISITVILALGYGFYKTRRDKNYHTL